MGYHNAITVGEFVGVQKRANQSDPEKPFLNFEFKLSANSDFTTSLSASQSSGVGKILLKLVSGMHSVSMSSIT